MGKWANTTKQNSLRKIKLPLKLLLFWLKKIKKFIKEKNKDKDENIEYPTIYISQKYPKMSILELYGRIKNHLKKHYPNIYNRIKSKRNESLIKSSIHLNNDSNTKESLNDNKNDDDECFFRNIYKGRELTEEIKNINKRNCSHIKHLFEAYKFEPNISEKYDNCFIQIIDCRKDFHKNINKDNLSTESSLSSSTNKNNKINKIRFVTHFPNNFNQNYNLFKINHL